MWDIIRIAFFIGSIIYQQLTKPEYKKPKAKEDATAFPRASEGDGISVVFGYAFIKDPFIAWYQLNQTLETILLHARLYGECDIGDLDYHEFEYGFFYHFQEIICLGNIDKIEYVMIKNNPNRCDWNENISSPLFYGWDSNTTDEIIGVKYRNIGTNQYNFNNPKQIYGYLDIEFGAAAQSPNTFLNTAAHQGTIIPAYRGVTQIIKKDMFIGLSPEVSPTPDPWQYLVSRIHKQHDGTAQWYDAKSHTGYGLNAIHIIRELIISEVIGAGLDSSFIDSVTFEAAADTCYSEGIGLSYHYNNTDGTVKEMIERIMEYAVGFLWFDMDAGKFKIKLFRNDYVYASLDEITVSDVYSISDIGRQDNTEVVNDVTIIYTDRFNFQPKTAKYSDQASVDDIGINSETVDMKWLMNGEYASALAMQTVLMSVAQLHSVKITGPLELDKYNPGDVFKLTDSRFGWSGIVVRVLEKSRAEQNNEHISLALIEDFFGLGVSGFGTGDNEPTFPTLDDVANDAVFEMPYVMNRVVTDDPDALYGEDEGSIFALCSNPSNYLSFGLWYKLSSAGSYTQHSSGSSFNAIATLKTAVGWTESSIVLNAHMPSGGWNHILIGNEILYVYSKNTVTDTLSVYRGMYDTLPEVHSVDAVIYILDFGTLFVSQGVQYQSLAPLTIGSEYSFKLVSEAITGGQNPDDAEVLTLTPENRSIKPINAAQPKVNGYGYESDGVIWIGLTDGTPLTWQHRNRLTGWNSSIGSSQLATGLTAEAGTLYKVEIWDITGTTLIRTEDLIDGDEYDYTTTLENADFGSLTDKLIKISSKRLKADAVNYWESYQTWSIEVRRLTAPLIDFYELADPDRTVARIQDNTDYGADGVYVEYSYATEPGTPAEPADPTTGSTFYTGTALIVITGIDQNVWVKAVALKNGQLSSVASVKNY